MKAKLVMVSQAVKLAGYDSNPASFETGLAFGRAIKAVRAALQRGAIPGERDSGGQWLVDPAVVATYLASRQQKGEAGPRFVYQQKIKVGDRTVGIALVDRPQWDRLVQVAQAAGFASVSAMATAMDTGRVSAGLDLAADYHQGSAMGLKALAQTMGYNGIGTLLRAVADGLVRVSQEN